MMRKLLTVTCGLLCTSLALAAPAKGGNSKKKSSGSAFSEGSLAMDITVGAPTHSETDFRKVMIPPLSLCIDGGIASVGSKCAISLGGIASYYLYDVWGADHGYDYRGHHYTTNLYYDAEMHNIFIAFRGAFHFDPTDRIDLYGGLLMGGHWKLWNYIDGLDYHSYYGDNPSRNKFCFGPFLGARFFVGSSFGFKAEFGVDSGNGLPYAQGGITFKLK